MVSFVERRYWSSAARRFSSGRPQLGTDQGRCPVAGQAIALVRCPVALRSRADRNLLRQSRRRCDLHFAHHTAVGRPRLARTGRIRDAATAHALPAGAPRNLRALCQQSLRHLAGRGRLGLRFVARAARRQIAADPAGRPGSGRRSHSAGQSVTLPRVGNAGGVGSRSGWPRAADPGRALRGRTAVGTDECPARRRAAQFSFSVGLRPSLRRPVRIVAVPETNLQIECFARQCRCKVVQLSELAKVNYHGNAWAGK